jgi:hypothetical protein
MVRRSFLSLAGGVAASLLVGAGLATPTSAQRTPDTRVVAIGDIHGAYQPFVTLLRRLGLLDEQGRWAGGTTTLVQTGDFTDRGVAIRPVMDLLMTLERQAEADGGRVITLLGNHETMNMMRLLQDASPEAIATFADDRSEQRRTDAYRRYVRFVRERRRELGRDPPGVQNEEEWMKAHPLGLVEYLEAFSPKGTYGRWLRDKQVVVNIDGTVFLHGGLNPKHAGSSLNDVNRQVRDEVDRLDKALQRLLDRGVILPSSTFYEILDAARADLELWVERQRATSPLVSPVFNDDREYIAMLVGLLEIGSWSIVHEDGPLWFRGFAYWSPDEGPPLVDELQRRYRATRFVVGHTVPAIHEIVSRFDERVFLIDTGMLSDVYLGGRPSALEIKDGRVSAIYLDREVLLVEAPSSATP